MSCGAAREAPSVFFSKEPMRLIRTIDGWAASAWTAPVILRWATVFPSAVIGPPLQFLDHQIRVVAIGIVIRKSSNHVESVLFVEANRVTVVHVDLQVVEFNSVIIEHLFRAYQQTGSIAIAPVILANIEGDDRGGPPGLVHFHDKKRDDLTVLLRNNGLRAIAIHEIREFTRVIGNTAGKTR